MRCRGKTKTGTRCKNTTWFLYCRLHKPKHLYFKLATILAPLGVYAGLYHDLFKPVWTWFSPPEAETAYTEPATSHNNAITNSDNSVVIDTTDSANTININTGSPQPSQELLAKQFAVQSKIAKLQRDSPPLFDGPVEETATELNNAIATSEAGHVDVSETAMLKLDNLVDTLATAATRYRNTLATQEEAKQRLDHRSLSEDASALLDKAGAAMTAAEALVKQSQFDLAVTKWTEATSAFQLAAPLDTWQTLKRQMDALEIESDDPVSYQNIASQAAIAEQHMKAGRMAEAATTYQNTIVLARSVCENRIKFAALQLGAGVGMIAERRLTFGSSALADRQIEQLGSYLTDEKFLSLGLTQAHIHQLCTIGDSAALSKYVEDDLRPAIDQLAGSTTETMFHLGLKTRLLWQLVEQWEVGKDNTRVEAGTQGMIQQCVDLRERGGGPPLWASYLERCEQATKASGDYEIWKGIYDPAREMLRTIGTADDNGRGRPMPATSLADGEKLFEEISAQK